jgi:alkanesulfonate monooxygenase SsuD/methylene tetrahydromethanopterin reductase-like flavin-dependent oxidoreductase (luciferase family)
MFRSCR